MPDRIQRWLNVNFSNNGVWFTYARLKPGQIAQGNLTPFSFRAGRPYWWLGMNISAEQPERAYAEHVTVSTDTLSVELSDGRTIVVPVSWYPRLEQATKAESESWELIGGGTGIHWEAVDEDISVEGLLAGKPSKESQASLARWLASRSRARVKGRGQ